MDILLIRHAESTANTERVFSNTGWKHGLTEKGLRQARHASDKLKYFFGKPDRVYSSGLRRAYETALVIAEDNSVELRMLPELAEFSVGILEGRSDPESWRLHNSIWDRWFTKGELNARLPGGESLADATLRFKSALLRLEEEEGAASRLVLISHGGFMMAGLLNIVYGVPEFIPRRGYLGNCDMVRLQIRSGAFFYISYSQGLR